MTTLHGRTVLVTGATSGFGEATARLFAKEGARQVLLARRKDRLERLCEELEAPTHPIAVDVADQTDVLRAIQTLPPAYRDVSVLVNNAGLSLGFGPAHLNDLDDWDTMVDTNIKGVLACVHAILPRMVERDEGHIVNIGSIAGRYPYLGGNVYAATKAFVHQLSLNLRADLAGTKVRVTCVEPGMAETEFALVRFKGDADKAKALYKGIRPLDAVDVAQAVLWCVRQPAHVNVNVIELMPVNQAFTLGFPAARTTHAGDRRADTREER